MLDHDVFAVEEQNAEFLGLVVRNLRVAVIDQLVPCVDNRPLPQFETHQPQRRLAQRFDRHNAGEAEPGFGRTRNVVALTSLAGQFEQPYGPMGPPTLFTIPVLRYITFSVTPAKAGAEGRATRSRNSGFPLSRERRNETPSNRRLSQVVQRKSAAKNPRATFRAPCTSRTASQSPEKNNRRWTLRCGIAVREMATLGIAIFVFQTSRDGGLSMGRSS